MDVVTMPCHSNTTSTDVEDFIPKPKDIKINLDSLKEIVVNLFKAPIKSKDEFDSFIRQEQKHYHHVIVPIQLLYAYKLMLKDKQIERNKYYEQFLKSKKVRGMSGVMVITVLTSPWPKTAEESYNAEIEGNIHQGDIFYKPLETQELAKQHKTFSCKYSCHFCPQEDGMPRSYLKREPAVARATQHRFDPIEQFRDRGFTYLVNGHQVDKIELLVLGGTWSSYPKDYQEDFIRDLYYAANTFFDENYKTNPRPKKSLFEEIKLNEDSVCRIIGLTLETRPDQINPTELTRFRMFGVTRVQIGVQHFDDDILRYVNRGCYLRDTIYAIKLLKDNCFKVDIHLMPDLPSSNQEKDRIMFEQVLNEESLQVDQIKIYPCAVVPWTQIEKWYNNYKRKYDTVTNPDNLLPKENRIYKPYAEDTLDHIRIQLGKKRDMPSSPLIELLMIFKSHVHPYVRLNRIVRDIPGSYISGGTKKEDLRQVLQQEMKRRGLKCKCIRCREVKDKQTDPKKTILVVREYKASCGIEYFISFESSDYETIYGFLRLRISPDSASVFPELKNCALMRELHVYGEVVPVYQKDNDSKVQHMGFGKRLIQKAEEITMKKGLNRIAVIAGVGVRSYYRKQGYFDEPGLGNFQIKTLTTVHNIPSVHIVHNKKIKLVIRNHNNYNIIMICIIILSILLFCIFYVLRKHFNNIIK